MRENTIPPLIRFTKKKADGTLAVEISRNWMQELFDYEELGAVEYLDRLKKRDEVTPPEADKEGLWCKCGSEVFKDDKFCPDCGQRLKKGSA